MVPIDAAIKAGPRIIGACPSTVPNVLARRLYSLLWIVFLPLILARLWWKGRREPAYRRHLDERLARFDTTPPGPCLWIHAVSVGETRAAQPLIKALRARYPDVPLLLTHMTPTGRATAAELYTRDDPAVTSIYLPYDLPWLQRRFLAHYRPLAGAVMETEVWPNLVGACVHAKCPLMLVNARLSERSAKRYQRLGQLAEATFAGFELIAAQAAADAARLSALGGRGVRVTGNIKFDNHPSQALIDLGRRFRQITGDRAVVLAASTREDEEAPLLAAATALIDAGSLFVIVPRHPQRFDDVTRMAKARGWRVGRRSHSDGPAPSDQIWIGDSMGEMTAYFTLADVTLMGGTWQPLGGQNFIECCAVGTPVLLGPSTFNFAEAAAQALATGAARACADPAEAMAVAGALLANPSEREHMGAAGREFAQTHGGATERTLAHMTPIIDAARSRRANSAR